MVYWWPYMVSQATGHIPRLEGGAIFRISCIVNTKDELPFSSLRTLIDHHMGAPLGNLLHALSEIAAQSTTGQIYILA